MYHIYNSFHHYPTLHLNSPCTTHAYYFLMKLSSPCSTHPYIFFNQDRESITFVGFTVTPQGHLIDPATQQVLENAIMTPQLYEGLERNGVNFKDNYQNWEKEVMIEKISTVIGVKIPQDPDESYVLTVDNLIKVLAIQMRFRYKYCLHAMFLLLECLLHLLYRCGIPVVIMGETGCGKTRLIRYMCDLARQGREGTNMLIMKVFIDPL